MIIFPKLLLIASLSIFVVALRLLIWRVSIRCLISLMMIDIWHYLVLKRRHLSTTRENGLYLSVDLLPVTLALFLNLQNFCAVKISALNSLSIVGLKLLDNHIFVFKLGLKQLLLESVLSLIACYLIFNLLRSLSSLS